jgi:hypothetical protein
VCIWASPELQPSSVIMFERCSELLSFKLFNTRGSSRRRRGFVQFDEETLISFRRRWEFDWN